jgi:hypothetical protein
MVYLSRHNDPDACVAGQRTFPDAWTWHNHHWCNTCEGWYGVPHDGIHAGPDAHPHAALHNPRQCACRPCQDYIAHTQVKP